jgi:hypothetical protein
MTEQRFSRSPLLLGAALCLLAVSQASAQLSVVTLKTGVKAEGFITTNDDRLVKIETAEGKTLTFAKASVESIEETKRWGDDEIDAEYAKLDAGVDAEGLAQLASTAKNKNLKFWEHLAAAALKIDPLNETANVLHGRERVGDEWFSDKKKADDARKKLKEQQLKDQGYVSVGFGDKKGWIKKEDKIAYDRKRDDFVLDEEGFYRPIAEVMAERGMELSNGKWIPRASPEDKADCAAFKTEFEVGIVGMSSKHFRIFSTEHTLEKVAEFAKLAEDNYKWFLDRMGKPRDFELFPGGAQGEIWFVKDKRLFDKAANKWGASRFGMSPDWIAYITQPGHAASQSGLRCLEAIENSDESGCRAAIIHATSHMLLTNFVRWGGPFGVPAWLMEGWAHYAEHHFMRIGQRTCSTKANYGAGGGISEKRFTTKDAKDRCKAMILDGEDDVIENISKKPLNTINGDDMAKGYTMVDWLMKERQEDFVKFLEALRGGDEKTGQPTALKTVFGWTFEQLDAEWKKWAKRKF